MDMMTFQQGEVSVIHHLEVVIHHLEGVIHHLEGVIHHLEGVIHHLEGVIHHLEGVFPHLEGEPHDALPAGRANMLTCHVGHTPVPIEV
jgi:G protein-coupled receptor 75